MATAKETASGLTRDYLCSLLSYDAETGVLTWSEDLPSSYNRRAGKLAGRTHRTGYVLVKIDGAEYAAHRIIWVMMTGRWPEHDIDHVDRVRSNNRWANLRGATRRQNLMNTPIRSTNRSGVKGVWLCPITKRWHAYINVSVGVPMVERFDDKASAIAWRQQQERVHYGEFCGVAA